MPITIHNAADFASMRLAGKLAAEVLDYINDFVNVGVTTKAVSPEFKKILGIVSIISSLPQPRLSQSGFTFHSLENSVFKAC